MYTYIYENSNNNIPIYTYQYTYILKKYQYENRYGKKTLSIRKLYFCAPYVKKQRISNAQSRCNLNSELCIGQPLFLYIGGPNIFVRKSQVPGNCVFKHVLFFQLLFLSSRPPQTMGHFLDISIAGRKCLCVSGNVISWSKHFDIIILVPVFYLKMFIHI